MDGRKYQRKRGFERTLVILLALVMLESVCFPAMRVNAEGTPDIKVTQYDLTLYTCTTGGASRVIVSCNRVSHLPESKEQT